MVPIRIQSYRAASRLVSSRAHKGVGYHHDYARWHAYVPKDRIHVFLARLSPVARHLSGALALYLHLTTKRGQKSHRYPERTSRPISASIHLRTTMRFYHVQRNRGPRYHAPELQ